ncbi:MAG: hypothetical protein R2828_27180 [Saprospiraceae bacterium]
MITVINKIFIALSLQDKESKVAYNPLILPVFILFAMVLMYTFCLTQNINLFSE